MPNNDSLGLGFLEDVIVDKISNLSQIEFETNYEENRKALLSYRFWRDENLLPSFHELPIIPIRIGLGKYAYYKKAGRKLSRVLCISRTEHVQKSFFQDLDKPLLVENEMNLCHWEYLYDNVRRSEDYGGDNHVYMSYDNIDEFLLFLCVENIMGYLLMEKFVFLFGREKETDYPMDFFNFGIDYGNAEPSPIRVEEINRLFVNTFWHACVGNSFFTGLLDYHKDVLTIKGFGLSDFVLIYKNALCGKTIEEFEESFFKKNMEVWSLRSFTKLFTAYFFETECPYPDSELFFECLRKCFPKDYKPNEGEWLKGFFLAYAMALGRTFKGRIAPAIKFETHFTMRFPNDSRREGWNKELFSKFKYCRIMIPMRYLIVARASCVDKDMNNNKNLDFLSWIPNSLMENYIVNHLYSADNTFWGIRVLRLEDFKLYPKELLLSLCDYLDITWDDMLLKITANGTEYMAFGTGAFDTAPLKKCYYNVCNPFDYYRIELVMSKYWKHFGYEPLFYKGDDIYTEEEILKMFELPFQCEQYITDEKEKARIPTIRKHMYELVKKRLHEGDVPLDENGQKMIPIPWLKPKMEYVDGELYH